MIHPERCLSRGEVLVLPRVMGMRVECREGCLWLTGEGVPGDVLLRKRESLTLADARRVVLEALADACVRLAPIAGLGKPTLPLG